MHIIPSILKELRAQKKISRDKLSDKSKVSVRQISRIENAAKKSVKVREHTMIELAKALKVDQRVLTGEFPMPEPEKKEGEKKRIPITTLMTPETRLAYALIKNRYGINPTTIINIAPLFFVLLAENSLIWRREKLLKFNEAAEQMRGLSNGPDHFSFVHAIGRAEDAAVEEQKSIDSLDIFGNKLSDDTFVFGYDPDVGNPFADYLKLLSKNINDPDIVELDDFIQNIPIDGFPSHELCNGELNKFTNGSEDAARALRYGHVRLTDIPNEFWAEDKGEERARWIEDRASEYYDDFINSLDLKIPGLNEEEENGDA